MSISSPPVREAENTKETVCALLGRRTLSDNDIKHKFTIF